MPSGTSGRAAGGRPDAPDPPGPVALFRAPGRPAEAEVEPARMQSVEQAELLDHRQRRAVPQSVLPPDPTRMVRVAAAASPIMTAGVVPATPGLRWCSANQYLA